ncbi:hypothetical protein POM88_015208 [Heracleum sosnowskyi]|uniref:Uncharacterized protein n=1 Tax=Heracleum sosnowskyi TaxID=360622 RepID=A0AAD8MRU0_9APIA|nr:hypothetical protein POM88_015208 [Heracleum sosnowskyi]
MIKDRGCRCFISKEVPKLTDFRGFKVVIKCCSSCPGRGVCCQVLILLCFIESLYKVNVAYSNITLKEQLPAIFSEVEDGASSSDSLFVQAKDLNQNGRKHALVTTLVSDISADQGRQLLESRPPKGLRPYTVIPHSKEEALAGVPGSKGIQHFS